LHLRCRFKAVHLACGNGQHGADGHVKAFAVRQERTLATRDVQDLQAVVKVAEIGIVGRQSDTDV